MLFMGQDAESAGKDTFVEGIFVKRSESFARGSVPPEFLLCRRLRRSARHSFSHGWPRSRAQRNKKIPYGAQRRVSHFVLKGKTDDGIKEVFAGNNLPDRLLDVPTEREAELRLSE
jgi:hypothetical protein